MERITATEVKDSEGNYKKACSNCKHQRQYFSKIGSYCHKHMGFTETNSPVYGREQHKVYTSCSKARRAEKMCNYGVDFKEASLVECFKDLKDLFVKSLKAWKKLKIKLK